MGHDWTPCSLLFGIISLSLCSVLSLLVIRCEISTNHLWSQQAGQLNQHDANGRLIISCTQWKCIQCLMIPFTIQ